MGTDTASFESVLRAQAPEELFGALPGTAEERRAALGRRYRALARRLHPDRASAEEKDVAARAFARATELRAAAEHKLALGLYGDARPVAPPVTLRTRRAAYTTLGPVLAGDVCELHPATREPGGAAVLLKVAVNADDGDLLESEAETLRALFGARSKAAPRFLRYLPELKDSMTLEDGRRANVLPFLAEHRSLAQLRGPLDFRDVAWMAKRVLAALGFIHEMGFVHGAVLAPHVLVHPVSHGAVLVGFCHAVPRGERVRLLAPAHRALYPGEVLRGEPASPGTDLYMAARTFAALLPAGTPARVLSFFEGCAAEKLARRPDDAWALHEELDQLLASVVGKRTYRPLSLE